MDIILKSQNRPDVNEKDDNGIFLKTTYFFVVAELFDSSLEKYLLIGKSIFDKKVISELSVKKKLIKNLI